MIPVAPASDNRLPALITTLPPVHEVIVVVGPAEPVVRSLPRAARIVRQTRTGSGNALACGVAVATGDVIVTLPGDGTADPADLPRLVAALGADADVAETTRPAGWFDLVLLWLMRVLLGCRPAGMSTGYRAFRRRHSARLGLPRVSGIDPVRGDGADGEPLIVVRSRAAGLRVTEVPAGGRTPIRAWSRTVAGVRAVTGEWRAGRREVRTTTAESIVVLTGGPDRSIPPPVVTGSGSAGMPLNVPRGAETERRILQQAARNWPAPNPAAVTTRLDHLNSTGLTTRASGTGLPANAALSVLPEDGSPFRRRWRDNRGEPAGTRPRAQGRPDLRVINGEGGGSGGGRGHLRSV
ncbi:MAG TPA: glycosyltransferase [Actinoplanes sp.]|nr:glycosyltransferase [Actinoplanes sp.]